jgi:hypothetical protein
LYKTTLHRVVKTTLISFIPDLPLLQLAIKSITLLSQPERIASNQACLNTDAAVSQRFHAREN